MSKWFSSTETLPSGLFQSFIMLLVVAGCVTTPPAHPSHRKPAKPAVRQSRPVDAKAQQRYYDRGLQYYSKENYDEAEEAFQQVIEFGPNTELGLKAKENLKKIEQIQKTIKEIESK